MPKFQEEQAMQACLQSIETKEILIVRSTWRSEREAFASLEHCVSLNNISWTLKTEYRRILKLEQTSEGINELS